MTLTNLNRLDPRVRGFDRPAFARFKTAVAKADGRCTIAVHLGFGLGVFFGGKIENPFQTIEAALLPDAKTETDTDAISDFVYGTSYEVSLEDYTLFLRETRDFLSGSASPTIFVASPAPFCQLDIDSAFKNCQEKEFAVIQSRAQSRIGYLKPIMEYSACYPFRGHWAALRDLLSLLGVKHLDLVGEFFVRSKTTADLPSPHILPSSYWDFFVNNPDCPLCVGAAAFFLVSRSKGKLIGDFVYPFVYPGLVSNDKRVTLAQFSFAPIFTKGELILGSHKAQP